MVASQRKNVVERYGLSLGRAATLACLLESSAPKPGNVHAGARFHDMTLADFVTSAHAIGPAMEAAAEIGIGRAVLAAIKATRAATEVNTNLGTVLLLAPLAAGSHSSDLRTGTRSALESMTGTDADAVFQAIRLAEPGGLGRVDCHDVQDAAPADLMDAMGAAAERDLVARQYCNGFADVFGTVLPALEQNQQQFDDLAESIVATELRVLAAFPDSLIARKCGHEVAREASARAAGILSAQTLGGHGYAAAVNKLDAWLRADGHRRNPGTTADLIAAGLFVGILTGKIEWRSAAVIPAVIPAGANRAD